MLVNALQLSCNQLLSLVRRGLTIFRSMSSEALPTAHTQTQVKLYILANLKKLQCFRVMFLAVCALMGIF